MTKQLKQDLTKMVGTRVKVWGKTASGLVSTFAGCLDGVYDTHVVVDRLPVQAVTKVEACPAEW